MELYYTGGNVKTRTDNATGIVDSYAYDAFDQLQNWTSTGGEPANETYGYDGLGNQTTSASVTKTFGGSGISAHQIATRTSGSEVRTFGYDPLGRQTTMKINGSLVRTVDYTPFDLPTRIMAGETVGYIYDANQHKFGQLSSDSNTFYVGDLYEHRTNQATCKVDDVFYVYAEGQRVAQVVQEHNGSFCLDSGGGFGTVQPPGTAVETISALHSDVQGTVSAVTTFGTTNATTHQAFSPWGERLPLSSGAPVSSIDKVTVGFTDQEVDDTLGLVNMRGRIYDSVTRTFLTPDPIVGKPFRSGGWSKYAYVLNNPLKYVDPSGFDGDDGDNGITYDGPSTQPGVTEEVDITVVGETVSQGTNGLGADQSITPSTPAAPESFDPGECATDACIAAAVTPGPQDIVDLSPGANPYPDPGGAACNVNASCGDAPFVNDYRNFTQNSSNWLNDKADEDRQSLDRGRQLQEALNQDRLQSIDPTPAVISVLQPELAPEIEALEEAASEIPTIDTAAVQFSQDSVKGTFRDGTSLNDAAAALRSGGKEAGAAYPPIRCLSETVHSTHWTIDDCLCFPRRGHRCRFKWLLKPNSRTNSLISSRRRQPKDGANSLQ